MSPAKSASKPGKPRRKVPADIYTALLAFALVALIIGIVCLYLELAMYEFKSEGAPRAMVRPVSTATLAHAGRVSPVASHAPANHFLATPPSSMGC